MILTLDARQGTYFPIFVTQAITDIKIINGVDGDVVTLAFTQDSTGHSVAAGSIQGFVAPSSSANALSISQVCYSARNGVWVSLTTAASTGGSPGGTDTAVQFNNAGAFGGDANSFSWNESTKSLTMENGGAESVFGWIGGATGSMDIIIDATQDPPSLDIDNSETGGTVEITADGNLTFESASGAVLVQNNGSGALGFYGATGSLKITVTGSKVANAALTSLLEALAELGLITDSTT